MRGITIVQMPDENICLSVCSLKGREYSIYLTSHQAQILSNQLQSFAKSQRTDMFTLLETL